MAVEYQKLYNFNEFVINAAREETVLRTWVVRQQAESWSYLDIRHFLEQEQGCKVLKPPWLHIIVGSEPGALSIAYYGYNTKL
jgi:hypothetical protein